MIVCLEWAEHPLVHAKGKAEPLYRLARARVALSVAAAVAVVAEARARSSGPVS